MKNTYNTLVEDGPRISVKNISNLGGGGVSLEGSLPGQYSEVAGVVTFWKGQLWKEGW